MVRTKQKPRYSAPTADKHLLYELSVQEPEADRKFINRVFKKARGRKPMSLREDFCGTAKLCAEWVASAAGRTAIGVDLDGPTLEYGRGRHLAALGEAAERVTLLQEDVLTTRPEPVDVVCAFNFSYWIFHERATLLRYFQNVRAGLRDDGIFFLDYYGGPEAQIETEDRKKCKGFTYVWDQDHIDAITGLVRYFIHFEFPDGTRLDRAFRYDWRLWGLSEIRDLLAEAGFGRVDVYWEGTDEDGEGDGVFRKRSSAENEEAWIAYLAARPA